ncbi:hypothetical protein D4764_19G0004310, partial [Takifugu flavidus]
IEKCPLQLRGQRALVREPQGCNCSFHTHKPCLLHLQPCLLHPAGPPLQSSTVLLQPQLPSSMSSSQQDAGDNRSIPGTDRVDELAEYLVELREQTGLTLNDQQDYKKIRQLVLCNGTLMQQTTLQRVVNQTTLMQWNNQRLKGQEASVLLQDRVDKQVVRLLRDRTTPWPRCGAGSRKATVRSTCRGKTSLLTQYTKPGKITGETMAEGLTERYQRAGEAAPGPMHVDRGCCRALGVSSLEQLFDKWVDRGMLIRLDIFHWIRRFDAAVRTDHHSKCALFKSALSAAIFSSCRRCVRDSRTWPTPFQIASISRGMSPKGTRPIMQGGPGNLCACPEGQTH